MIKLFLYHFTFPKNTVPSSRTNSFPIALAMSSIFLFQQSRVRTLSFLIFTFAYMATCLQVSGLSKGMYVFPFSNKQRRRHMLIRYFSKVCFFSLLHAILLYLQYTNKMESSYLAMNQCYAVLFLSLMNLNIIGYNIPHEHYVIQRHNSMNRPYHLIGESVLGLMGIIAILLGMLALDVSYRSPHNYLLLNVCILIICFTITVVYLTKYFVPLVDLNTNYEVTYTPARLH